MPALNTRKVEIGGEPSYLPKEDARVVELLRRGVDIQLMIASHRRVLDDIKRELVEIAERERGVSATVRLRSPEGQSAKVVWGREIEVDPQLAEELRKELGPSFDMVFTSKTIYGRARSFAAWMDKDQGPLQRLKAKVQRAFHTIARPPTVRLFDVGEDD